MSEPWRLVERAPLRARNTFGVPATADLLLEVRDAAALPELFGNAMLRDGPVLVLGGGSNLLFAGDPPGVVLALGGQGIAIVEDHVDGALVRAEAGVDWHALVLWTLGHGLSGLENLALIPGTVGAAPIQNIGAYGVEVGECIDAVEAFERGTRERRLIARDACGFGYRDSRFKREPERYVVTAVRFRLQRAAASRLGYAGLAEELAAMGIDDPRPSQVAEAVCRLRRRKLPDPALTGNAGSFFKNPVVAEATARELHAAHPGLPVFPVPAEDERKLSAAWLIDACGWKGRREGDAGVSERHALVLVNHGAASGADLLALARRVAASVQERFGVALEPEPRIVGATW
ncbi:UDP-N-acetylmuramate dehydrogenase [Luteimonas sp. RD2P54]|uniref:UDP-N-acetylenolpyruvoylglucosamine reductase n=1 Tax=Luteimonas endophytica TaxID=3042023 RepID=A0ABT6J5Y3_9GAMM|nr:UDP-N-acetylmuramate dehydrogenase [Luteimonas endophytica]MDH5821593.1 UDP-N-acetylmuramate dehydrogenase [Luteimonas endophytica]